MKASAHLVVMAGGSGTRFWPKSTALRPKQLLSFGENPPLIIQTLDRFNGVVETKNRWIATTELLEPEIRKMVSKDVRILAEPQGRNTAPCIYWAAREIQKVDSKAIMLVMPSDHYIPREEDFRATVQSTIDWAEKHDDLVTLGVAPTRPETGYGYLKLASSAAAGAQKLEAFVEKPSLEKAKEFLTSGRYLWNGGMFIWRVGVILAAFDQAMPEMKKAWESSGGDIQSAYPKFTATSIDYGVMEKAKNAVTFKLDCGWDDLGSWTSLENLADALHARHKAGVVTAGECLAIDSTGNIVDAPSKTVALLGVDDLIVVESGNSILVARKDRAQDIRKIVELLNSKPNAKRSN